MGNVEYDVADRIRTMRKNQKLSQQQLSIKIQRNEDFISNCETHRSTYGIGDLKLLCEHFDISADALIWGEKKDFKTNIVKTEIQELFDELKPDQQGFVIAMLKGVINTKKR